MQLFRRVAISLAIAVLFPLAAAAQNAPQDQDRSETPAAIKRTGFVGNDMRLAVFNNLNTDCSAAARPDVRVVTPPANGTVRVEALFIAVDRPAGDPRAHCVGKRADSVGVFYKAKKGFVGDDQVVLDVDFKTGNVRHFVYAIEVR
ncbi:MAG: hypothetical protein ACLPKB_08500 [Xanthobacteraceae bacterium]